MTSEFIPVEEGYIISIMKGSTFRRISKEYFEAYMCDLAEEVTDTSDFFNCKPTYINALEWIICNTFRTAGIQLYEDGEIRINIMPSKIKDNKKCIFLKDSNVENRSLDDILYGKLEKLMNDGITYVNN